MVSAFTAKAVCGGTLRLVFEPAQLFRFIDKSSWAGSKTSQKSPAQTTFAVAYIIAEIIDYTQKNQFNNYLREESK